MDVEKKGYPNVIGLSKRSFFIRDALQCASCGSPSSGSPLLDLAESASIIAIFIISRKAHFGNFLLLLFEGAQEKRLLLFGGRTIRRSIRILSLDV